MQIISAKQPQWANAEHTAINLMVTFAELGEVPFTAAADDEGEHGPQLYANAIGGNYGTIAAYVGPTLLDQAKGTALATIERNRDAQRYANVTAHTRQWQADANSQDLLSKTINLAQAGLPLPTVWRDADNSNMPISSINDLLAIAGGMAAQTQAAYAWSWAKKAEIEAASTVEELAAMLG